MAPPARPASARQPQTFAAQPTPVKAMLLVFLVAVLGALYYFSLHSPLVEELDRANRVHRDLQDQMAQAEERQREYIRLREELAAREAIDRANRRVLPEQAEMASFLQDLNRLAETSGLQIRLVEPRPEEPDVHYTRLPVLVRVSGRYHQIARFFYNVSRLERAISLEDILMQEPRVEGEDVILQVEVLATTYRRPTDAEATAAATAGG